jgi:hypothetical protein
MHINCTITVLLSLMMTSIKDMALCVKAIYCKICFNSKVTQKGQ